MIRYYAPASRRAEPIEREIARFCAESLTRDRQERGRRDSVTGDNIEDFLAEKKVPLRVGELEDSGRVR